MHVQRYGSAAATGIMAVLLCCRPPSCHHMPTVPALPVRPQWVGYYTERNAGNAIKELEVSAACVIRYR